MRQRPWLVLGGGGRLTGCQAYRLSNWHPVSLSSCHTVRLTVCQADSLCLILLPTPDHILLLCGCAKHLFKKSSMFPNIRNTWFNQSSPLQCNPEDFFFILIYFFYWKRKKLSLFPNIINMQFDQSSPVPQIPEKKSGKICLSHKKNHFFQDWNIQTNTFSTPKNAILLVFEYKN